MRTFYKIMTVAIDVLLTVALGLEIKDRIVEARKKNNTATVTEPEPVTED